MKTWILLLSLLFSHSAFSSSLYWNSQNIKNPMGTAGLKSRVGLHLTQEQIQRALAQAKARHTNDLKKAR